MDIGMNPTLVRFYGENARLGGVVVEQLEKDIVTRFGKRTQGAADHVLTKETIEEACKTAFAAYALPRIIELSCRQWRFSDVRRIEIGADALANTRFPRVWFELIHLFAEQRFLVVDIQEARPQAAA